MKIQPVYILLLIGIIVSSCMGNGDDTARYQRLGIAQTNPRNSVFTVDSFQVTAAEFESMNLQDGDCFLIEFMSDIFNENNKEQLYNVDIISIDTIPVWPMPAEPIDTTIMQENGEFLSGIVYRQHKYVKERFFLTTEHRYLIEDEEKTFELSYNLDYDPVETEDGKRVYELFLRTTSGGGTDTLGTRWKHTNAFIINDFVQKASEIEESVGNDRLILRMRYPRGFNTDSTAWIWEKTDTFSLQIPD